MTQSIRVPFCGASGKKDSISESGLCFIGINSGGLVLVGLPNRFVVRNKMFSPLSVAFGLKGFKGVCWKINILLE